MSKPALLIDYLYDLPVSRTQPVSSLLADDLLGWMEHSTRFTAFVETYQNKIRKKLRLIRQPEAALDLRSELEVAYRLLNDRRLEIAYEPYASEKRRGPDFAVTYRVNLIFNVEVARIRPGEAGEIDASRQEERILRSLLDKLGQMQPGRPNLLAIQVPAASSAALDLERLMQAVKTRAERKDPAFFAASRSPERYASPADFYKDFLRLSGILLWSPGGSAPGTTGAASSSQAWQNKPARPALDEKVFKLIGELLGSVD